MKSYNMKVASQGRETMKIQYVEIVTPDVDAVCNTWGQLHGLSFRTEAALGNARVAELEDGGLLGVRAPMHEQETPVVRPYVLVDDVDEAARKAVESGAELAHEPMELPGHGKFAIFIQGGIQQGLWQLP